MQDAARSTHLHRAAAGTVDQPQLVSALLAAGAPPNASNTDMDTPLHLAARAGHIQVGVIDIVGSVYSGSMLQTLACTHVLC